MWYLKPYNKMQRIIHHIRRQPEHVRTHILHVLVLVCGIILALLWIYSLGTTLTSADTQNKVSQDLKPFALLKDNVVDGYKNITNSN